MPLAILFFLLVTGSVVLALVFGLVYLMGPVFIALVGIVVFVYLAGKRRERQAMLLWHLALAVRRGRPLGRELRLFAADMPGRWRSRLEATAKAVDEGDSLPSALGAQRGLLPRWAVCSLRVGSEAGRLPESLLDAARRTTSRRDDGSRETMGAATGTFIYLVAGFYVVTSVLSFIMVYIIPKFKKIFEGFGTQLPAVTDQTIAASDFAWRYWYVVSPVVAFVGLAAGWITYAWYRGWSEVHPPLWSRLVCRLDMPNVARDLAVAVEGNVPLPDALNVIGGWQPHSQVNRRLIDVADDVSRGGSVWTSLQTRGFLRRSEATLLASAERLGNLPWALREFAGARERLWWYRTAVFTRLLEPAVVLLLGAVVGFLAVAFFVPLVSLIQELS